MNIKKDWEYLDSDSGLAPHGNYLLCGIANISGNTVFNEVAILKLQL